MDSPHHMGYWMQVLAPVYSYLVSSTPHNPIRTVLIPNLSRGTVMSSSWVMELIKIATTEPEQINSGGGGDGAAEAKVRSPVRILFWDDLENTPLDSWLGFEKILHVYTRYSTHLHKRNNNKDNKGFFASAEIAEKFRLAVHKATGIPQPVSGAPVPLTITYLMPTDSSGVTNNKDVLDTLQHAAAAAATAAAATATATAAASGAKTEIQGESSNIVKKSIAVRPYSPTPSVPLASLVAVMSRTRLLIGRHAPLLANAAFLPPGAVVVEILPYNWNSGGRSEIYKNLTASRTSYSTDSIVHVAWRAPSGDWMQYESDEDSRYSSWTPLECSSDHCTDAHARAGVKVNVEEFRKILDDVLNLLLLAVEGNKNDKNLVIALKEKVRERYPWPRRVELTGSSGLWWDRGG